MNNEQKIPSVYSYSPPTAANEQQFGYDLSPSAVAMVNTKLELDTQDTKLAELESLIHALEGMKNLSYANVRRSDGNPGFSWKSSEEIVTDYLTKVFEAFSHYLERVFPKFSGTMKENYPVDLVITVPVQWSYKARNSTYRAVINAGFNPSNFLKMERIIMIREPEAAALYAVRWLKDENVEFLKVGDCFVLCDAGGGTVDVVAYKVLKLEPLELKQIGHPTCRKCGSICKCNRRKHRYRNTRLFT
jgi:molecular chaperone DnaK (HSP70)